MSGGGGAPAVQAQYSYSSPFQNPAYNAVAMGTKQSPGPIARSIQIGNQLAQNWQDSYTGANPGAYYGVTKEQATPQFLANQRLQQGAWSPPNSQTAAGVNQFDPDRNRTIAVANPNLPTQTAAQGGLMSLGNFGGGRSSGSEAVNPQGYAKGGPAKPKYNAKSSADDKLSALQTAIDGGYKPKPAEVTFMQGMADSAAARQKLGSDVPFSVDPKTGQIKPAARGANQSSADYAKYLGQLDTAGAKLDPKTVKQYGVQTGAATQQQNKTSGVNAPYSLQQAVEQRTAYFDPTTGESTNPLFRQAVGRIQEAQKLPEQFGQATDAYKTGLAGLQGMTNYQPQQVASRDYTAARMTAPEQAAVKDYEAAQMNAATMQGREAKAAQINRSDVRDINAIMADVERYQAAGMQAPPALQAEAYQAAQMQGAQLQGPKSWTDVGTAEKYMSPYQQAVTDQELYEANRQAQMRENQQRSQATQQKAFGGTRAALQESEGRRNLGYLLSDIQNKGSQQAYTQGMQQFSAEQGLGLQAGQSNLQAALTTQQQNQQALNQQRSLYVQQALDAAKTSYGGELTAAQANQVAANAASQFNAGAQNLAYNNYAQQQLAAQQANQGMDWNVANQNAQLAQQAELANQQYGLGGFQSNLNNAQFAQQAAQQNQAAINQQRSQYVNNALQAAMQAYGGQLTAEQQNQAATNAASQFNAQQNLQGQMANQSAGLQANQQNLGAYGQLFQGAQGLGALGASQASTNLANIGALGQAAQAQQNLGQQYLNNVQQSAQNYFNWPQQQLSYPINAINQLPSSGGATTQTQRPASPLGWKKGGLMNLRKARRA